MKKDMTYTDYCSLNNLNVIARESNNNMIVDITLRTY